MKSKKIIPIFFILSVASYIFSLVVDPFFFADIWHIASLLLTVAVLLTIFNLTKNIIWKHLSSRIKSKYLEKEKIFNASVLFCIFFFFCGCWIVNNNFLPEWWHPVRLDGFIGFGVVAIFTFLLGWMIFGADRKKPIFLMVAVVVLFAVYGILTFQHKKASGETLSVQGDVGATTLEQLRSLPYMAVTNEDGDKDRSGVATYDPKKAFSGYNFYKDENMNVFLMNMAGKVVYTWKVPCENTQQLWAELLENGEILAICIGEQLMKLDRYSDVLWNKKMDIHHGVDVVGGTSYLALVNRTTMPYNLRLVVFEAIVRLASDGQTIDVWSVFDNHDKLKKLHKPLLLDSRPKDKAVVFLRKLYFSGGIFYRTAKKLNRLIAMKERESRLEYNPFVHNCQRAIFYLSERVRRYLVAIAGIHKSFDYYHMNFVEELPETSLGKKDQRFQRGNYMVCFRNADLVVILDKDTKDIVWSWGPDELDWPHMPTMLDNGNMLIFDNGYHRSYSRVIEVDPISGDIVWEYKADPPESFHSKERGSSQRLPNGNTLICESEKGRVFEVTKQGKIVWEFLNPEVSLENKRVAIARMFRVIDKKKVSFLKQQK